MSAACKVCTAPQVHRAKDPSPAQEIDYELEGQNADRFRRNFAGTPWVKVPRVYWPQTSTKASYSRICTSACCCCSVSGCLMCVLSRQCAQQMTECTPVTGLRIARCARGRGHLQASVCSGAA